MTSDERKDWVASLKLGDKVIFVDGSRRVATVDDKQRGCPIVGSTKFNRLGQNNDDSWHPSSIEPWSAKEEAEINEQNRIWRLKSRLARLDVRALRVDQIERISAILDEKAGA